MLKYIPKKILLLFLGDVVLIYLAYSMSKSIRFKEFSWEYYQPSWTGALIVAIYIFTFYIADLYGFGVKFKSTNYLFRFFVAVFAAAGLTAVAFFMFPPLRPGRGVFLINTLLILALIYSWRLLFEWYFKNILRRRKRILIVGAGWSGWTLYETIRDDPEYEVVGFLDDNPAKWGVQNSPGVLGGSVLLKDRGLVKNLYAVVIAITHLKGPELLKSVLECKMQGVRVYDMPALYKEVTGRLPVEHVDDFWFVSTPMAGVVRSIYTQRVKRVCDVVFSIIGLIFSLPITVVAAVIITWGSRGPVFFKQKRVGLNGVIFEAVKFRSMRTDAEQNGAVWADKKDPRVTRVGKIIRKWRIDEIPQMWNVLKGEMSFIGPRPERPEFVQHLNAEIPFYPLRHTVKPGITGWAQVNYRYGASKKDALEKLQYDLFYIKNLSALLDAHILLKTVRVVLFGMGAR